MAWWVAPLVAYNIWSQTQQRKAEGRYAEAAIEAGKTKKYPYQTALAKEFGSYMTERIGTGLSPEEKTLYRSTGRGAISEALVAEKGRVAGEYGAQGLRGGAVAGALRRVGEGRAPAMAGVETAIMGADIAAREQTIAQVLQFLGIIPAKEEWEEPGAGGADGMSQSIQNILAGSEGAESFAATEPSGWGGYGFETGSCCSINSFTSCNINIF
ncbi:unnamed protein product [marine sediment metagenome]|uniref:Uncharacterized protein n=1 Tax=marine sediment metagenome TaxID=412755 RepID=X0YSI3_9ZZZZ